MQIHRIQTMQQIIVRFFKKKKKPLHITDNNKQQCRLYVPCHDQRLASKVVRCIKYSRKLSLWLCESRWLLFMCHRWSSVQQLHRQHQRGCACAVGADGSTGLRAEPTHASHLHGYCYRSPRSRLARVRHSSTQQARSRSAALSRSTQHCLRPVIGVLSRTVSIRCAVALRGGVFLIDQVASHTTNELCRQGPCHSE